MGITALSAKKIAEQQLLTAIRLWRNRDYISAITLAGAAEEILGKRLRSENRKGGEQLESSFDNLKSVVVDLTNRLGDDDPETVGKRSANLINQTKNQLKHYAEDEELELDLPRDSVELIERAIANYRMLTKCIHQDMLVFWAEVDSAKEKPTQPD